MKVAILDDILTDRENLRNIVSEYFNINNIKGEVCLFKTAEGLLKAFNSGVFALIFLDIKMDGISGMECARLIRKNDKKIPLVFVTSAAEFALEGYEVYAAGFVVKPFDKAKIFNILEHILSEEQLPQYISIKEQRVAKQILLDDILYAETRNHYVEIHTANVVHRCYMTYEELRGLIPDQLRFQSCYRGILVNFDRVIKFNDNSIVFENGESVPVARSKKAEIQSAYASYAFEKTRKGTAYEY